MKTIDKNKIKEAANNYVVSNFLEECTMKQYIIDSFETGFELCKQVFEKKLRWIPVEEKYPIVSGKFIIKFNVAGTNTQPPEIGIVSIGFYFIEERIFDIEQECGLNVTHWRFIL
jgi:hypothetical protein